MNLFLKLLGAVYNEAIESFCTRLLYFFNTINTYFLVVGISAYFITNGVNVNAPLFLMAIAFAVGCARIADFYPLFIAFSLPAMVLTGVGLEMDLGFLIRLAGVNVLLFFVIQFLFMGIPDSIVSRDPMVAFRKMWLSLFTVAPTTVSFSMSVFFSLYLGFWLKVADIALAGHNLGLAAAGCLVTLVGALVTRQVLPRNRFSRFHKPDTPDTPLAQRVVLLNIDGCRKDVYDRLSLPARDRLVGEGTSHACGLKTVYRALTNPAFASIFTGTVPGVHGVSDNNLGQSIRVEGLPDIVPTIAYGSMHVKHFCKEEWETRIVSLPRHSIYHSDDIMMEWVRDDMLTRQDVRLFVADFSEADFLGHAYGSTSVQYKRALERIDGRIGNFLDWLEENGMDQDTTVIVCSDHGIAAIDHSYLIAPSEKYVPFMMRGTGIKAGYVMEQPGTIMDICCTIAYLLGIQYPAQARGRVATDCLENGSHQQLEDELVTRVNALRYDAEAATYGQEHVEVVEGDAPWWDNVLTRYAANSKRLLDVGCGNGFVGQRFLAGSDGGAAEFICCDVSSEILEEARQNLGHAPVFRFVQGLENVQGTYDCIAASSVFHHVADPQSMASRLDRLLAPGGIIVGSHEPDRSFFTSRLACLAATFWKRAGGGISMKDTAVHRYNAISCRDYPNAPRLCEEEILQMSEYHSPLEQYMDGVDSRRGFVPTKFIEECFPGYEILELDSYTTFFHRPALSGRPLVRRVLQTAFSLIFGKGNLFRYVIRKPLHDER